MGLTTIVSSSASSSASASSSSLSLLSPVGIGVGGIFVAVALLALLAYFDLLDARQRPAPKLKRTLATMIVPLLFTFGGVVVFESLQVL